MSNPNSRTEPMAIHAFQSVHVSYTFNENVYDMVISRCALLHDIAMLSAWLFNSPSVLFIKKSYLAKPATISHRIRNFS